MRLICPNCDAEYQVDDAAIPDGGRDVQCSNCGHAWFQLPADAEIAQEAEAELFGDDSADVDLPTEPALPVAEPVVARPSENTAVADSADTAQVAVTAAPDAPAADVPAPDVPSPDVPTAPAPVRQSLAESVLSVLREEAEREKAVRREAAPMAAADRGAIETQTEFGLDDAAQSASTSAAARHIARLKGSDTELAPVAETRAAARRDLLPDIEEINSTLRANSDRAQEADNEVDALPDIKPRRRGFRSGFVLMMIVAVALAMAYIMAPRIIAQIPGSAAPMNAYVSAVDSGRIWLDGVMKSASGSLRSFSGDAN